MSRGGLRPARRTAVLLAALGTQMLAAQAPSAYLAGKQAFADRRYADAAKLFAQAAQESGAPPDAVVLEAKAQVNAGDFSGAERTLEQYTAVHTRSADALYLLAYTLERQNQPKASLEALTRAAAIAPPTGNDLKIAALDYVLLEDYPDAVRWLDRAVSLDPTNAEAWYDLGRCRMHQGKFSDAEAAFGRTLALQPNDSKALNNLGLSLEAQNRSVEALSMYQKAVLAQANAPHPSEQPLLNLGTLLNTQNRGPDAISPLREAIHLAPKQSRCHEELARALQLTHQDESARAEMQVAVQLDDRNPRLHYQLGQMYRRAGMVRESESELKRSATLYGTASSAPDPL